MEKEPFQFEICANGVESSIAAQEGGAHRVELCAGIPEGGTTPSYGEIKQARQHLTRTRLHVIIRPRGGDFIYTPLEAERMLTDIGIARQLGADGVVFGCLTPEGDIDTDLCRELMKAAQGMSVTFHRAFDCCRHPRQALEEIIALGCHRLLTSGQQPTAEAGIPLLRELHRQAGTRIALMAGCGVNEENIVRLHRETGITQFHFSARTPLEPSEPAAHPLAGSFGRQTVTTAQKVRNTMKKLILCLLPLLALVPRTGHANTPRHFITDDEFRHQVHQAFCAKSDLLGGTFARDIADLATPEEAEALQFLYAYMPLADITDYPVTFHLQNVRASFRAQQEMSWGKEVPELLFRHFVLPVRVNNEPLDSARMIFYEQLKERVRGLKMDEAILEVNHWCHEHVTYAPSDARTLSPLACINNALGRCGEESTLTVAALRSVGIPARQVYTPRWAHTDDNHAWVEAWADGRWHFLGACEPEPVLDLGWFNAPASRAMLMHTRAFGDYRGPEEVMLRTSCYTEINLIDNYGSSARIDFHIVDTEGNPVNDARVDFKIYNYAEFCTVATKYTDDNGDTFLSAGCGDMLVWASRNGACGYTKASFGKDRKITLRIASPADGEKRELDIVPPPEKVRLPAVSEALNRENQRRLAREDSLRQAYEATFYQPSDTASASPEETFLLTSRGNWRTIQTFIRKHPDQQQRVLDLLGTLSDKDLRDMPLTILEDHLTARSSQLCPRVENEMITRPYKHLLQDAFDDDTRTQLQQDPARLVQWVKDSIRLNPDIRALRIAQTPAGVWHSRLTDTRSRSIFFVALARSLDIEARKDPVTGKVQYKNGDGRWVDVDFQADRPTVAPQGTLVLTYQPDSLLDNPKYYSHFTISRITPDGATARLNFEEGQVDMGGGTDWESTFRDGALLDTGTYLLTAGTRLASGSVLATTRIFTIREGQTTTLPIELRQSHTELSVIGTFDSESRYRPCTPDGSDTREASVLSHTGRGYFIVGLIATGHEPSDHALRDIAKVKRGFDNWNRPILLLFENEEEARKWNAAKYGTLPRNLLLGIDTDGTIRRQIAAQMKLPDNGRLPLFLVADTFNRVVFLSQGYTIGLGEQLQQVIKKL
ncbi:MAG: transglutaminase domain-containing protein [Coprobacter sp.]|nr:transglutaminase domain-containing protein [Coprobacter sp.]